MKEQCGKTNNGYLLSEKRENVLWSVLVFFYNRYVIDPKIQAFLRKNTDGAEHFISEVVSPNSNSLSHVLLLSLIKEKSKRPYIAYTESNNVPLWCFSDALYYEMLIRDRYNRALRRELLWEEITETGAQGPLFTV